MMYTPSVTYEPPSRGDVVFDAANTMMYYHFRYLDETYVIMKMTVED